MNRTQVLEFTEAFPPAHKLTETLMNIEYKKHFHSFMDAVETICVIIAAIAVVIAQKWQQYDCTERLQLAALTAYTWTREVAVPGVKKAVSATYNAGGKVREVYNVFSSPLFITL